MIYCPECGTANRDGSKFCNECGRRMSAGADLTCPGCGTLNLARSVFCSNCGGPLPVRPVADPGAAAPPPTGPGLDSEEPEPQPAAGTDEEIPAWVRELGATLAAESSSRPLAAGQGEGPPASRPSPPAESQVEAPFPSLEPQFQPPEVAAAGEGGLPDWLAELRPRPAEPSSPPAPAAPASVEERALPAWLAELRWPETGPAEAPSEPIAGEEGGIPGWPAELQPPAGIRSPAGALAGLFAVEAGAIPDWPAELQPPSGAPSTAGAPGGPAGAEEDDLPYRATAPESPGTRPPPAAGKGLAAVEPQAPPTLTPAKTYEQDDRLLARLLSLELRDKGTDVEGRGSVGQAGILDGITGGLVVAAAIAKPRAAAPGAPEAAPVETPEARLFAEIAALAPAAAFKSSARLARRTLSFTPHLIDHALLLAALAASFFLRWSPLGKG